MQPRRPTQPTQRRNDSPIGGLLMIVLGVIVIWFLGGALIDAIQSGSVRGRQGRSYPSGTINYYVSLFGYTVGTVIAAWLIRLGLKHIGLFGRRGR